MDEPVGVVDESIKHWIESRLASVAQKLPDLVHEDPASFACGYNAGYKAAALDLERYLESGGLEGIKARREKQPNFGCVVVNLDNPLSSGDN